MIYALSWDSTFFGPCSNISEDRDEVVEEARRVGLLLVEHYELDSIVDCDDDGRTLSQIVARGDADDVIDAVDSISTEMFVSKYGYMSFLTYDDVFELADDFALEELCTEALCQQLAAVRRAYRSVIRQLDDELCGV
jgi:hypothetical protein